MSRILHLTTVHPIDDVRIFQKEVRSLRRAGLEVVVAGIGVASLPEDLEPAIIFDRITSRRRRFWASIKRAIETCRTLRPDILHFHDPEILFAVPFLRRYCGVVIYDSHECVSEAVHHKHYLPIYLRPLIGGVVGWIEKLLIRFVDAVIVPTPHIEAYFGGMRKPVVRVANYPQSTTLPEFASLNDRRERAVYTGALAAVRGLPQMVEASKLTNIALDLAGSIDTEGEDFLSKNLTPHISVHGYLSHAQALALQSHAMVGMSLLMPKKQYLNAIPTKVFEFLAAGLIVVCSDFPFLRRLFSPFQTVRFVDPENVSEVADAMRGAIADFHRLEPALIEGREIILREFTWDSEMKRLLELYEFFLQPSEVK